MLLALKAIEIMSSSTLSEPASISKPLERNYWRTTKKLKEMFDAGDYYCDWQNFDRAVMRKFQTLMGWLRS